MQKSQPRPEKRTYQDLVREYFPKATDEEVEFILWEKTAFPFASEATLREQLALFRDRTQRLQERGPCPICHDAARNPSSKQIDAACTRFRADFPRLPEPEKTRLRNLAQQWLAAWQKTLCETY